MKKFKVFSVALLVLFLGFIQSSCIGSFRLTNKVYEFNKDVGSKFVSELLFLVMVIVPVYAVSMLIDGLILNSIEFWSGSNPMAMNAGESETKIIESNGIKYQLTASQNRFDFIQLEGANKGMTGAFVYDPETGIWSYEDADNSIDLVRLNADGTATAFLPNGKVLNIEVSGNGLASLKSVVKAYSFVADK
ncbi:MAG: DUF3332 domain-containing protein [Bacteroidales bacterium]